MSSLHLYETMSGLTGQMVDAARAEDWDRLCELEKEVAGLRDRLASEDPITAPQGLSDSALRAQKLTLIRRMLDDDRTVRSYTEPWMESVRSFLAAGTRTRNVRMAYQAFGE
ncbi:MAG: flagellar protein FliT [Moraxellaceae bacterium]|nr:flagellar protein FliT [Moraxellaceae bacterium]